jgi:hypothetical protein
VSPRFTAPKFREIHRHTGILDFERGREDLGPFERAVNVYQIQLARIE